MLLSLLTAPVLAADVTEVPPMLRGDISVGYTADLSRGSLVEPVDGTDVTVGKATHEAHIIDVGARFAVAPGAALYVNIPTYALDRWTYKEFNLAGFDPTLELGSMASGELAAEDLVNSGSGAAGVWLGAQGTPFSEAFAKRGNKSTWLLDVGFRTKDSTNFYTVAADGTRGAGNGSGAFRLTNAFSTTKGQSEPWLQATWTRQGTTEAGGVLVDSANQIAVRTGVEVTTFHNPVTEARFSMDFRMGFAYNAWADVPSGTYLPSVMTSTEGTLVTMSEYSTVSGGLGLYWRMFQYGRVDLFADATYILPHRVEHPYPVYTGFDTFGVTTGAKLTALIRPPKG
ncbi:MAG: hypothetical protein GY913_33975 [Proteobacteria bacterium]|nr:hypothetical protein [Pseudomonadota bacterium]MCP4921937.1 hypothetical protein [Pseudomonadota bacterium]